MLISWLPFLISMFNVIVFVAIVVIIVKVMKWLKNINDKVDIICEKLNSKE